MKTTPLKVFAVLLLITLAIPVQAQKDNAPRISFNCSYYRQQYPKLDSDPGHPLHPGAGGSTIYSMGFYRQSVVHFQRCLPGGGWRLLDSYPGQYPLHSFRFLPLRVTVEAPPGHDSSGGSAFLQP